MIAGAGRRLGRGRTRSLALLAGIAVAAVVLTATDARITSAQQAEVLAMQVDGRVPVRDPWATFWGEVPRIDVPLSAQANVPPAGGRSLSMGVQAVHDGADLYVALEWGDPSEDRSVAGSQRFADAVAVQFPAPAGVAIPAMCMGDPTSGVNIWQWKAAWQEDIERGFRDVAATHPNVDVDMYPFADDPAFATGRAAGNPLSRLDRTSPVEHLIAAGFGTLTTDEAQRVDGWGEWRDGVWRVVFRRPLTSAVEGAVDLGPIGRTNVAFAVWDGEAEERDGMKSVGNFVTMRLVRDPLAAAPGGGGPSVLALVVVAALGGWIVLALLIGLDVRGRGPVAEGQDAP
jgi:hypothetical protein